ncbi:MAG TPA: flagellar hook-length control protein FliK, partial [Nitrospiraceae bacterium]|nr:flagellar hook-length control protein FliK [Nitrospiraceae bacterium]
VTLAADQHKTAQALLGEDHSAMITSTSGKAQAVHVELPSHDSGPLSVRISMTDQMVHTQFTTDRNDLGALLFTRQDQLQQNLAKSGLELGQFQVHIDQQGRQEALPDRQSRQNGGASEQQPKSQDHNQPAHDRERPIHRPSRVLSLFA